MDGEVWGYNSGDNRDINVRKNEVWLDPVPQKEASFHAKLLHHRQLSLAWAEARFLYPYGMYPTATAVYKWVLVYCRLLN